MAKKKLRKSGARKPSQRAAEMQKEKEEEEKRQAAIAARRKASKGEMKTAMIASSGGLLTVISLVGGLLGILAVAALIMEIYAYRQYRDYGWRGKLLPIVLIIINVIWIGIQIACAVSPTAAAWFTNLMS